MSLILEIPNKHKVIETSIAYNWLDENGYMCSISKKAEYSVDILKTHFKALDELSKGQKRCFIVEPKIYKPMDTISRKFLAENIHTYLHAIAFIVTNPMMVTGVNIFLRMKYTYLPMKVFTNKENAIAWLKTLEITISDKIRLA